MTNPTQPTKLQKTVRFIFKWLAILSGLLIGALFIGLLIVGPPQPPARETPVNALITLGLFLCAGITIYTFRGGCKRK